MSGGGYGAVSYPESPPYEGISSPFAYYGYATRTTTTTNYHADGTVSTFTISSKELADPGQNYGATRDGGYAVVQYGPGYSTDDTSGPMELVGVHCQCMLVSTGADTGLQNAAYLSPLFDPVSGGPVDLGTIPPHGSIVLRIVLPKGHFQSLTLAVKNAGGFLDQFQDWVNSTEDGRQQLTQLQFNSTSVLQTVRYMKISHITPCRTLGRGWKIVFQ